MVIINIMNINYNNDFIKWNNFLIQLFPNTNSISFSKKEILSIRSKILELQDPILAYYYAINFNNHLYEMEQIIIKSKNIKYMCNFVCQIPESNYKKIEKIVLESKKLKYISMLLALKKYKNINKYINVFMGCNKPKYLLQIAKHVEDKKILSKIEDEIIDCKSSLYIRLMASKIKNANIAKLEEAILALQYFKEIKKFVKNVKKSTLKNFLILN